MLYCLLPLLLPQSSHNHPRPPCPVQTPPTQVTTTTSPGIHNRTLSFNLSFSKEPLTQVSSSFLQLYTPSSSLLFFLLAFFSFLQHPASCFLPPASISFLQYPAPSSNSFSPLHPLSPCFRFSLPPDRWVGGHCHWQGRQSSRRRDREELLRNKVAN